jgi:hypothetical protein
MERNETESKIREYLPATEALRMPIEMYSTSIKKQTRENYFIKAA